MAGDSGVGENELDELLRRFDPVDGVRLDSVGTQDALDAMGVALSGSGSTRRQRASRRPRMRVRTGVIAAAVLTATATVAAAAGLTAHTGHFQPTGQQIANASPSDAARMRSELAMGGPGEFLDPSASDYRDVALQVASDVPYPSGYGSWRDFLISQEIKFADGGTESSGALHGWFAASAFCAWLQVWRQADLNGDAATAGDAAQMISGATGWKAVTDEDPHPSASVPGDGGSTYSLFGWMLPYRDAVVAGDRAAVEGLLSTGYGDKCWTSDPGWMAQFAAHPEWGTLSRDEMARNYERFLAAERS